MPYLSTYEETILDQILRQIYFKFTVLQEAKNLLLIYLGEVADEEIKPELFEYKSAYDDIGHLVNNHKATYVTKAEAKRLMTALKSFDKNLQLGITALFQAGSSPQEQSLADSWSLFIETQDDAIPVADDF